jgi:hypothetical protein
VTHDDAGGDGQVFSETGGLAREPHPERLLGAEVVLDVHVGINQARAEGLTPGSAPPPGGIRVAEAILGGKASQDAGKGEDAGRAAL